MCYFDDIIVAKEARLVNSMEIEGDLQYNLLYVIDGSANSLSSS